MFWYTRHPWLVRLRERRSSKIAAIALANKIARIAWAMMARIETFQPSRLTPVWDGNTNQRGSFSAHEVGKGIERIGQRSCEMSRRCWRPM